MNFSGISINTITIKMTIINLNLKEHFFVMTDLIVKDMKLTKLFIDLPKRGYDISSYELNLSTIIFFLTGIIHRDPEDHIKEWYCREIDTILNMDLDDEEKILKKAEWILVGLVTWKSPEKQFGTDL